MDFLFEAEDICDHPLTPAELELAISDLTNQPNVERPPSKWEKKLFSHCFKRHGTREHTQQYGRPVVLFLC